MAFWTRPIASLERWRAKDGKRFTIRLPAGPPFVMITEPEQGKQIFTAPPHVLPPGEGAAVLQPVVGSNSVLLLDEAAHMEQRKLMLPAFHGERMALLTDLMNEVAEREVMDWPRGTPIEMHPRMQALTLEVILRAVFGLEPGRRLDDLRERLRRMLEFGDRPISLVPPDPDGVPAKVLSRVGPFAKFVRMQEEADALIFELIEERRRDHDDGDDVLAMLLDARHEDGSPMTDQELRDELMTLLVAGHETTATSLSWALERLVRHPDKLERLREGDDEYVDAVAKEALRLRPGIPTVVRRLTAPVAVGGYPPPAGVTVAPCIYLVHRRPDVYPDPYAFRPERFLEQPAGTYTWIPFGGGVRRCLGASFAIFEMKAVLRAVSQGVEALEPVGAAERPSRRAVTLVPARDATISVARRAAPARREPPVPTGR